MRTIKFLLQKEFKQIFRNKGLLPVLFIAPLIQLIILPLAADYEVKNISLAVVDHDHSSYSRKLVSKVGSSGYFKLAGYNESFSNMFGLLESDKADLVLEIPSGFEKTLVKEQKQKLFIAVNAINGVKAGLGGAYLSGIIRDYNSEIRAQWIHPAKFNPAPVIEVTSTNWYNPFMNYKLFMVPGILAVLITMVGGYMCALNIVKEKELGTIEQINVTPIKKAHFIIGKLLPFWIIGIFIFTVGLFGIGRLVYGIVPAGSMFLLYSFLSIYLVALLGFGLLISTFSETQQQAMSVAFFFVMIFMLMSGLFTPIDSMPGWAKTMANCNPVTYFIEVMRMIVMKGSGFVNIWFHFVVVILFAIGLNGWAMLNYRKTS
ncbi:MAG: transporter permease [Bacteroidetes bacterium]|jgi:ABC-2 type transport system permease protein|nr:transporter permease [Bacteroidota bacterium]